MGIIDLWLPIVVSAVVVFFTSAAVWMLLKWHNSDWHKTTRVLLCASGIRREKPDRPLTPECTAPALLEGRHLPRRRGE